MRNLVDRLRRMNEQWLRFDREHWEVLEPRPRACLGGALHSAIDPYPSVRSMRYPIPKIELEEWKASLSQWQAPAEFVKCVDELKLKAGPCQFFSDPNIAFGRDAFVAGKSAAALAVDAVRLCPDTWPDFELRCDGDVHQYEVSEADLEDRRRGDEYKATRPPHRPRMPSARYGCFGTAGCI